MANGNHGTSRKFTIEAFIWGADPEVPAGIALGHGIFLCRDCCRSVDKMVAPQGDDLVADPTDPVVCCRCFKEIL